MDPDIERLLGIVAKTSQGIGDETIVEYLSDIPVTVDGRFFETKKQTVIGDDGVPRDVKLYGKRLFGCGHIASRATFGGICSSPVHLYSKLPVLNRQLDPSVPLAACVRCIRRCVRCQKIVCLFCVSTVSSLPGAVFCLHCALSRKWGDFFKGRW